ncbi:uncharacterized protein LOC105797468 [Gossypium raimondii]|uniref:uncharacterized protein LOC105797468 n=1 Tax=Gossypium raimondii TaxID=29730 RepID=UPI00063AC890|nr:uncharacterized protein LOC105797468 [Gossypium raimondii]
MTNLEDLLKGQDALTRQSAIINLMNSQQKLNTSIKEHMLNLMRFFVELEDNEAELDVNTQIEMVFKSLTKEFIGFSVVYNLGNNALTLSQLINELQSYELMLNGGKPIQEKPKANLAVCPSSSKGKQKAKGKKKSNKSSIPPRVDRKNTKGLKDPKKIKCFFYNKKCHFR